MKEKFLFVGGKADGQMIEVRRGCSGWQIAYFDENVKYCPDDFNDLSSYPCDVLVKTETYRKIEWESGDSIRFQFFTLDSLPNREVMQMVLDNYKPKREIEENTKLKAFEQKLGECVKMFEEVLRNFQYPFPPMELGNKIFDLIREVEKFLHFNRNKN